LTFFPWLFFHGFFDYRSIGRCETDVTQYFILIVHFFPGKAEL